MKKTMRTLAALGLVCAMGTVSFAAETNTITSVTAGSNSASQSVKATYSKTGETRKGDAVYSVKIDWSDMGVTYKVVQDTVYKWNPSQLKYEKTDSEPTSKEWDSEDKVTINVTNSSDAAIKATAAYSNAKNGETITFVNETINLDSAAKNISDYTDQDVKGTATTGTFVGTISGEGITETNTLGNITVTIEPGN